MRAAASDINLRETDGRAQLVANRTSRFADAGSVSKDTVWFSPGNQASREQHYHDGNQK